MKLMDRVWKRQRLYDGFMENLKLIGFGVLNGVALVS